MSNEQKPQHEPTTTTQQDKQCRICFDGDHADSSLGRLFKPCLCTGTISYVHVKCLQTWRLSSHSNNAFWRCPQCHFHYRFARTKAFGLGTNSVVVGILSTVFFILLVMLSSYVTSYFLTSIEEQSLFGATYFFASPLDVAQDLVRAAIRILRDQDILPLELEVPQLLREPIPTRSPEPPSLLNRFVRRFLLGLPMIGVGSLFRMLLALPNMGPLQWIARWRGNRHRRGNDRDLAAAVIVVFIVIGAARTLYKVYGYTRKWAERFLTWAEDSILEVN
ncbi:hypothetical protein PAXRUDRAFT_821880 [Paxillus rubicundulus Ve08.2h10]|uniref:RING-CH-type domain-containing protein n=1 Tax=Paxillus rubicundulus Ve08.2h10 TaxID=930991 RepID=A0A0D0DN32_9AGAM|nr:hypothetical protein PAXRUDRAFT_821880 [Paxillus rubicundulus Ve08.2h10]